MRFFKDLARNFYLLLSGLGVVSNCFGQRNALSPVIREIARTPGIVNVLSPGSFINIPDFKDAPVNGSAHLVKTPEALFAMVDFTGIVYRLDTANGQSEWKRIDSTYFSGYNLGALVFYANNRIYSFGGSGLWQMTGHLRFFKPEKFEWEIQPVSREIPHFGDLKDAFWLDTSLSQLYIICRRLPTPALIDNSEFYRVIKNRTWRLDLKTGIWSELGMSTDTTFTVIGNSPWGMLCVDGNYPYIIDFKSNRYLKGNFQATDRFSRFFRKKEKEIVFFKDSTLWFGDNTSYVDSISFTKSDFVEMGEEVYLPVAVEDKPIISKDFFYNIILVIVIIYLGWFFWTRSKMLNVSAAKSSENRTADYESTNIDPVVQAKAISVENQLTPHASHFEGKELQFLYFILKKSTSGQVVSIDEVNRHLGLHQKSIDIQKSHRNKTIDGINQKMKVLFNTDRPVIDRKQNELDRRSNDYFIVSDFWQPVSEILQSSR